MGDISWHTLGPLVPMKHRLKTTAYLNVVADHVHPFLTTVATSSTLKKKIFALCSISLIKMSSYNITLGKNGPTLILLNINNVI